MAGARSFARFIGLALVLIVFTGSQAFALTAEQRRVFDSGVHYFDVEQSCIPNRVTSTSTAGGKIYVIGDSLTVGMRDAGGLEAKLTASRWTVVKIEALGGQPINWGLGRLRADTATLATTESVLIGLGTNNIGDVVAGDGSTTIIQAGVDRVKQQMQDMIDVTRAAKPGAKIYWTDFYGKGSLTTRYGSFNLEAAYGALNAGLRDVAGRNNVTVLPWSASQVAQNYVPVNDVHPNGRYVDMADFIAQSLSGSTGSGTGGAASCCDTGSLLAGANNKEKAWNYFITKGFTPVQAAGAMGNLQTEGGFNPKRVEDGWGFPREMDTIPPNVGPQGQPGYGIVQWTSPGRKDGLRTLATSKSLPVHDLSAQLDFMWAELEGPYKRRALDPLMQATDLAVAVRIWQDHYEVGAHFEPRFRFAQQILAEYGSGTPSSSSSTTGCSGSGALSGGLSLPLEKSWYERHPEWFTKPHHDYPAADIPVPTGTEVYSMSAGTIVSVTDASNPCGIGMVIDAGNGIRFTYCHSSDAGTIPNARQGDTVIAGQLIMHSNNTGRSTGPHLHLGLRVNGQNRCPQTLFTGIVEGNPPDIMSLPSGGCTN